MKTLVLVLGCRAHPYPALIETIESTWAAEEVDDVSVLFYYGGTEHRRAGRHLYLPVPDDLPNVGRKTIAAFDYALGEVDFDVVFRTNCSSYVDLVNLREHVLTRAPGPRFYAGLIGMHDGVTFASGSGYLLGRDLVELAVRERAAWDHDLVDDVALGAVLDRHGVRPEPVPRPYYGSAEEVVDVDTSLFHFRCHTDSPGRREDAAVMRELHRAFRGARGQKVPRRQRTDQARRWIEGRKAGLLARVRPGG
jgi:hypothetical protein